MHCVLGLDPGIGRTGYAFIAKDQHGEIIPVAFGCIETTQKKTHEQRFLDLFDTIDLLIGKHKPEAVVMEQLFFNKNQKTAIAVGQAQGVLLVVAARFHLPVTYLTPPQVKMAITGYGQADKKQIGAMVKTILELKTIPTPDDTADAIACALAYLYINPALQ